MISKGSRFFPVLLSLILMILSIVAGLSLGSFQLSLSHPLVLGMGGILLIVIAIRPHIGTYAMVATLWLSTLFPDAGGLTLNRMLGFVTLAGIFLPMLMSRAERTRFGLKKRDYLFVVYIFVVLLSVLINGTYPRTVPYIWELLMGYMIYWIVCHTIDNRNKLRTMLWILVVCNMVIAWSVINMFMTSYSPFDRRYSGGIQESNTVAVFNALAIIILLWMSEKRGNARPRFVVINYGLIALFSGAMFLTGSRTGLLTLISSLFVVIFFLRGNKAKSKVIMVMGLIFIIAVVVTSVAPLTVERILNIPILLKPLSGMSETSLERLYFNRAAWGMFVTHPITGIGFGGFGYQLGNYASQYMGHAFIAHNIYASALAETGILGFLIFVLFLGSFFSDLWKYIRDINVRQENGVDVVYPLALLVGVCVSGLFLWAIIPRLMFLIFSLGTVMLQLLENEKKDGLLSQSSKNRDPQ